MRNSVIYALSFVLILGYLAISKFETKENIENYFQVSEKINKLSYINNNLDSFMDNITKYNNFDYVESEVKAFEDAIEQIDKNVQIHKRKSEKFNELFEQIQKDVAQKTRIIQKVKSYNAILNNSYRFVQKLKSKISSDKYDMLFIELMTLDKKDNINFAKYKLFVNSLEPTNKMEKQFIQHVRIVFNYYENYQEFKSVFNALGLNKKLKEFSVLYDQLSNQTINQAHQIVVTLFVLLLIAILFFVYNDYILHKKNLILTRFSNAVENSDNIVVITDVNQKIKYVNQAFVESTGYSEAEAIGAKPSILQSGQNPKDFYKELNETIYAGKKWQGTFVNLSKDGKKQFEKASISPVFDDGKIIEFIALKLDITNEINTQNELRAQEKMMFHQSKMASMGEMLNNIAHHWRQPLSFIATSVTSVQMQKEAGILTDERLIRIMDDINRTIQNLSTTIDSFSDYFETNKNHVYFNLKEAIEQTAHITSLGLENEQIHLIDKTHKVELYGLNKELVQVLLNMIQNSRDVLLDKHLDNKIIILESSDDEKNVSISLTDNGGGIDEEIIKNIFEPYFTTKYKAQGTGIGLFMTYEIVTKYMCGSVEVENVTFDYEGSNYQGAKFTITIPKKLVSSSV